MIHNQSSNSWVFAVGGNSSNLLGGIETAGSLSEYTLVPSSQFNNEQVVKVASQTSSTIFLTKQGHAYLAGSFSGFLRDAKKHPVLLEELLAHKVVSVAIGQQHYVFLTEDNQVMLFGGNSYSELAGAPFFQESTFLRRLDPATYNHKQIVQILCGSYFVVLRMSDCSVYAWGSNFHNQLGLGSDQDQISQVTLNSFFLDNALHLKELACGSNHIVALTEEEDAVYISGYNTEGQCGLGGSYARTNNFTRVDGLDGKNVSMIRCGFMSTIALTRSGDVYVFGKTLYGHLGIDPNTSATQTTPVKVHLGIPGTIQNITLGNFFTIFQTTTGELFGLGYRQSNEFGPVSKSAKETDIVRINPDNVAQIQKRHHLEASVFCGSNSTFIVLHEPDDLISRNFNLDVLRGARQLTGSTIEIITSV